MFKAITAAALVAGLGGCSQGYGYGGVDLGYAGYGQPYYDGYGYGDVGYYGWYGDFYYPGTGFYVYDRYRRAYRWNDNQRHYWEGRQNADRGDRRGRRDNWNGFADNANRYRNELPGGARSGGYRGNGYAVRGSGAAVAEDARPQASRANRADGYAQRQAGDSRGDSAATGQSRAQGQGQRQGGRGGGGWHGRDHRN